MSRIIQFTIMHISPWAIVSMALFATTFFYRLKWRQLFERVEELEEECGELRDELRHRKNK